MGHSASEHSYGLDSSLWKVTQKSLLEGELGGCVWALSGEVGPLSATVDWLAGGGGVIGVGRMTRWYQRVMYVTRLGCESSCCIRELKTKMKIIELTGKHVNCGIKFEKGAPTSPLRVSDTALKIGAKVLRTWHQP
jgi:hypothetical protein